MYIYKSFQIRLDKIDEDELDKTEYRGVHPDQGQIDELDTEINESGQLEDFSRSTEKSELNFRLSSAVRLKGPSSNDMKNSPSSFLEKPISALTESL